MTELKPCPFCGETNIYLNKASQGSRGSINCPACLVVMPSEVNESELIACWNTRYGWMPIKNAPKDGTEIWVFNGEQGLMKWIEGDEYALWVWFDELLADADPDPVQPSHWMMRPDPPDEEDLP